MNTALYLTFYAAALDGALVSNNDYVDLGDGLLMCERCEHVSEPGTPDEDEGCDKEEQMKVKGFNCSGCPYLGRRRVGDSFDMGDELTCRAESKIKVIDPYCDARDFPPPLPEWCPRLKA